MCLGSTPTLAIGVQKVDPATDTRIMALEQVELARAKRHAAEQGVRVRGGRVHIACPGCRRKWVMDAGHHQRFAHCPSCKWRVHALRCDVCGIVRAYWVTPEGRDEAACWACVTAPDPGESNPDPRASDKWDRSILSIGAGALIAVAFCVWLLSTLPGEFDDYDPACVEAAESTGDDLRRSSRYVGNGVDVTEYVHWACGDTTNPDQN